MCEKERVREWETLQFLLLIGFHFWQGSRRKKNWSASEWEREEFYWGTSKRLIRKRAKKKTWPFFLVGTRWPKKLLQTWLLLKHAHFKAIWFTCTNILNFPWGLKTFLLIQLSVFPDQIFLELYKFYRITLRLFYNSELNEHIQC